jgi:hypothetical protein
VKLNDAPNELYRALRRLNPEQGLVGRRNARRAVASVLSAVSRALDKEFPRIKSKAKVKKISAAGRLQRWERKGYAMDDNFGAHSPLYAEAAIRIVRIRGYNYPLVPAWALHLASNRFSTNRTQLGDISLLRKLRLNRQARKLYMVEQALLSSGDDVP